MAKRFKDKSDFIVFALLVGVFVIVAAQRLGDVPVPQTDEAYTLQVPYEMLNRGQLSLPMYRYLGGNIENVWHSYTPLFFVLLSGFFKLFGWGLAQGRAFNLITAVLTLLMTWLIGRRLFNWRAGLTAVVLLLSDQTFFERSRLLRNDFAASSFAMLAFYLFEIAEEKKRARYYVAAGLAAGAGVMCHTNALYMLAVVGLLMLLSAGRRVFRQKSFYQFTVASLAVMAYEIAYDIADYKNFVLQNRGDELHFGLFEPLGWLRNIAAEGRRYWSWAAGSADFAEVPRTTLHVFQLLAVAAIAYLALLSIRKFKSGDATGRPSVRVFTAMFVSVLFHAIITSHKEIYYIAHLAPWFALCAGVMLSDCFESLRRSAGEQWSSKPLVLRAAAIVVAVAVVAFGAQLVSEYRGYLRVLREPEQASFEEFKSVLRSVVPAGVCPVAMKAPVMWLAFPEHDRCFASIEKRMMDNLDIEGKEYVVLMPAPAHKNRLEATKELNANYPLLAELSDTPYGDLRVYYTGANPELRALPVQQLYFFGRRRGYVSAEQVAQGREVWSRDPQNFLMGLSATGLAVDDKSVMISATSERVDLWTADLEKESVYQVSLEATAGAGRWMIRVVEAGTNTTLHQEIIAAQPDSQRIDGLFRTSGSNQVRLVVQSIGKATPEPLRISRVSIREIR